MNKSKSGFTIKIIFSYLILGALALVVGYFIFTEIKVFVSSQTDTQNDNKLLKTGSLLTELYEAESLSKIALQKKTASSFKAYTQKIDSVFSAIDSLKMLSQNEHQKRMLDSVHFLLQKKVDNSRELLKIKARNEENSSLDNALAQFNRIEESLGKITPESLNPNYFELPPEAQSTVRKWAEYLSENVPKDSTNIPGSRKVDSVLTASRSLLAEAKQNNRKSQRTVAQKELELSSNDIQLSRQLRDIISAFEQEVITNTYTENVKKQQALTRSIRLAGFASLLGFLIVGLFTFLITKDYWKVQQYRQRLEKEKKFSESLLKSREQLISTVSHDLRTPLNTISGYSDLMENTGLTGKQVSYLKQVKSASRYVNSLVNDLLDFSKLEAGKINLQKKTFILSELIRETAEHIQEYNRTKNLNLIIEIDGRLDHPVLGDPLRIRQILSNLIGNAYKFTSEGFIKIDASVIKEVNASYKTKIQIIDSGIGIKKEKQQHIFKEFTQADTDTDKRYGGYGLGLTISKKLTTLLGGKISLQSEENKGSNFIVELPLELSKTPLVPPKTPMAPHKDLSLLILDDDPAMLRLLKEVCSSLQIFAYTFSDFEDIEHDAEIRYDVVLTDIQMPNITGFEVLENLRKQSFDHYKGQPIVAMTGRRDLEKKVYEDAGFEGVLQKPFTKDTLVEILAQLFPKVVAKMEGTAPQPKPSSGSQLFSLDVIGTFLGDNSEAMGEVLHTFMGDTERNMELLKVAINSMDHPQINSIAHRMLPMFRQLKAMEIVPLLEGLEILPASAMAIKELNKTYGTLRNHVTVMLLAIRSYLQQSPITGQDRND
ncbi:MAG: ATP-binding protein [Sediminicola sp.]